MDPTQVASATGVLTALGLGKYAAGIVSLVTMAMAVTVQIMPFLPVPVLTSAGWYRVAYGLLARVTGNYRNNAPSPVAGIPAGGIVPTPPVMPVILQPVTADGTLKAPIVVPGATAGRP